MNAGIAIFVKTPGHSPLKTRLAAATGVAFASGWYERAAAVVAQVACSTGVAVYWAVAESSARRDRRWSELPQLTQGEGGLGPRLSAVQKQLLERHDAGLMIGADSPQLQAPSLRRALEWLLGSTIATDTEVGRFWAQPKAGALQELIEPALACGENRPTSRQPAPRQVIGPASDGGFWLYGSNRVLAKEVWECVPYSEPQTASRLRTAATHNGDWLELEVLRDVDTLADLQALQAAQADEDDSPLAALCAWTRQHWPHAR